MPVQRTPVSLDLDAIQATVLRYRPTPYWGTHILGHVTDARGGREVLRRLAPHVTSAADWWKPADAWIAVALSYAGLAAIGVPHESLQSFPESFRQGMAARSEKLGDDGENHPSHWDPPFGTGAVHIAVSIFSDDEQKWRRVMQTARQQFRGISGVRILASDDFGAQPGGRNSLGYTDGIGQPAIEGSGVEPFPGQGPAIKAGEFILGYPGESGVPLPMPGPDVLGRNGTFVGMRKYHTRVGAFNRFLRENARSAEEQELLAAKLVGRWRSGAPLMLSPEHDDPALGADFRRNNDFMYAGDPRGKVVPRGAHIRRMNPRDTEMEVLTDVNIHRIIRRGTTFGPPYDPNAISERDDEVQRGVYFLFLGARAMDTIEFLQNEWINNGNFMGLDEERDPIIGLHGQPGTFTIPRDPVRRRVHGIQTFNVLRGGEYLFMPSLPALQWMAEPRE